LRRGTGSIPAFIITLKPTNIIMESNNIPVKRSFWSLWEVRISAAVLVAMMLLLVWIVVIRVPPLIISEETTRITGPLTADGRIDFFKALEQWSYPPEIATDDNGFRIFVRLFGDVSETRGNEFYRVQRYEKLGLDPNIPPTLVFPPPPHEVVAAYYEAKGEEAPADLRRRQDEPWPLEQFPMLADWYNDINAPLDAIADAIRSPVFFTPLLQSEESVLSGRPQNPLTMIVPDVHLFREIARLYHARATHRIDQGDIDGAIDDKLTIHRLGRLVSYDGPLVQYLVGVAIEGIAMFIPVDANPQYPLTEAQIQRILDGLDALPARAPINHPLEWERYMGLGSIQDVAQDDVNSDFFGGHPLAL